MRSIISVVRFILPLISFPIILLMTSRGIHKDPHRHADPRPPISSPTRYLPPRRHPNSRRKRLKPGQKPQTATISSSAPGAESVKECTLQSGPFFLGISRMVWGLEFRCKRNEQGREMVLGRNDVVSGFLVLLRRFRADMRARSEMFERVVREVLEEARRGWRLGIMSLRVRG
ncbi:hypothetical protein M011DRAFT_109892 [Sporormia fimetaria CBS 119925]|uniref:Uncharacterized protein n=1 Tax=Sporormia fimetaria CBS 119925 TaxID=1340428 RepID=A0A6A6VQ12_9PLEO|nr:hypothetical protein M011DRAFT_109892 [Sporormia fimetaria CBS 119925]